MIAVTRLDGTSMIVNSDQIAWIEHMPDTVVSLMNGEKLIVRESPADLVERVKEFRRTILGSLDQRVSDRSAGPTSVLPGGDAW